MKRGRGKEIDGERRRMKGEKEREKTKKIDRHVTETNRLCRDFHLFCNFELFC